jgi:hypothetical protein
MISKVKACNQNLQKKFICKKATKIFYKVFMEYQAEKKMTQNY